MSRRTQRLTTLLLVALALRSLALLTPWNVDRLFGDEVEYASYARQLATRGAFEARWIAGPAFKAHRTPMFPAFLALNHHFAGEEGFIRAAKIMNLLVGSCIPVLVFLCVELLIGADSRRKRRAAFVCGLGCAAYPFLVLFGLMIMSELLFTALALLSSYLLLRVARRPDSRVALAAAGIASGLATLTRPGFVLFPVLAGGLLFLRSSSGTAAKRAALVAILLAAYGITLSPWLLRNYRVLGRFPVLATHGAEPLWIGNHPDSTGYLLAPVRTEAERRDWEYALSAPDELERDRRYREMALRYIRDDPAGFLRGSLAKAGYLWNVETAYIRMLTAARRLGPMGESATRWTAVLLGVPFPLLALAFFAAFFLGPPLRDRYLLTSFIAYSTVVSMIFFGGPRFHLPFVPQMIVCSSQLFLLRKSDLRDRRRLLCFGAVAIAYLGALASLRSA